MNKTTIEWTDYTWNPITGCDKISQGCKFCYAETMAKRFWGDRKFTDVQIHPERLNEPIEMGAKLHGKKVFVCDVSDLFHEDVPFDFIDKVFNHTFLCPDTIFQILTKRPEKMLAYFHDRCHGWMFDNSTPENLWFGVSCEDQKAADERIPLLLQIPAAVHFLSCEPLIGPINLKKVDQNKNFWLPDQRLERCPQIDWVIAGGESSNKKGVRPMHPDWVRSLRDQCAAASVPFFFKQWGQYLPEIDEMPESNAAVPHFDWVFKKVGKSKSGALLDGKEHREFPNQQLNRQPA